jgi:hypothetical protein
LFLVWTQGITACNYRWIPVSVGGNLGTYLCCKIGEREDGGTPPEKVHLPQGTRYLEGLGFSSLQDSKAGVSFE